MTAHQLPGVVRMGLIKRLASLTRDEFGDHWRGPHGMFAANIPNLQRYHQNHVVRRFTVGGLPDLWNLDGLSELWFDSLDIMSRSIASPAYAMLAKDTPTVMTMPGLIAGTQELASGHNEAVDRLGKLMMVVGRRRELTPAAFLDGWRALSASLCKMMCVTGVTNTVVSRRESEPGRAVLYEALPIDLVSEFWLERDTAMDELLEQDPFRSSVIALAGNVSTYAMRTYVIVA
jgi:uncharacterized protein (TIGR02118 family)